MTEFDYGLQAITYSSGGNVRFYQAALTFARAFAPAVCIGHPTVNAPGQGACDLR
jgi:hypothetical protein